MQPLHDEYFDQVYFVQAAESGRIKIGVSKNPARRLRNMQVDSPEKLDLLFYVKGSFALEKDLHERFSRLRLLGEWFQPDASMLRFLRELWRRGQAHRASFMGYDQDKFYAILERAEYDWKDREYVDGAIYHHGKSVSDSYGDHKVHRNEPAVVEFLHARTPWRPALVAKDLFTPREWRVFSPSELTAA